jgi:exopolysaccharide biosynthesis polyprenyl glycosylphosphotransferase
MKRISFVFLGDLLSFWVSFFLIIYIRYHSLYELNELLKLHILPFLILYLVWVLIFYIFGLYDLYTIKPTIPHLKRFGLAIIVSFIIGIFFFYFLPIFGIAPKTNLIFQIIGFGILSFFFRRILYNFYSSQITRPVILVGKTNYLNELKITINNNPQIGLRVTSVATDLQEALKSYSEINNAVFIFESISQNISNKDIVTLYKNNTEIIDITSAYEKYLFKIPIGYVSQTWIIENISTKKDIIYDFSMRIIGILFSLFILIISSPILLIIIPIIYLYDHGPIFYTQERVGLNGKIFKLFKLRSMIIDSEKNGAIWSTPNDPRITPIGKIIRKLHIDEIPQMINIIKGDISLVGPRPERPEFVKTLEIDIPNYDLRHIIRPGFTGWAQIKYHYANTTEDSKEKFEYDLYYIKNRNIFIDFGVIIRTIQIIFTH